jgi:hypothetical protein
MNFSLVLRINVKKTKFIVFDQMAMGRLNDSFTMPTLCLMSAILTRFGTVRRERCRPLLVLMNKAIKAIKRLRYDHPTSDLYGGKILPFGRLSIFQDMLLIFKIRNGLIKQNFVLKLLVEVVVDDTSNRSRGDFYVDTSRTNLGRQCMLPDGLIRFNNLPREIRDSRTLIKFKRINHIGSMCPNSRLGYQHRKKSALVSCT